MRQKLRGAFCVRFVLPLFALTLGLLAPRVTAQTTLLFEGFEGVFPNATWTTVTDTNTTNGLVYWNDVNSAFVNAGTHSGSWKGYCAGFGNVGTTTAPLYTNNMDA